MRILELLSTSSVTGPAQLCLSDAEALRREGHEVLFGCDTRREGNYAAAIRAAGFELMDELALCRKSGPGETLRDLAHLRSRLARADLVHGRFSHDHTLALLAMKGLSKRPAMVRTAEIAASIRPGLGRGLALRGCDAVIVSCAQYADRLAENHRVPRERIHAISGCVDAERFSPGDGSALRRELGVGDAQVLFGIVSRIKPERRHELLVRAFAKVVRERGGARLAIVGRGEGEGEIRALVSRLGLEREILFAGYRSQASLVPAYRALDAKIWLAEGNDGTCRAVLEAMACGKPVIVGGAGAMAELVRDGLDGFVCSLEEGAVAAALARLGERNLRERMGRSARERALFFGPERRAAALWQCYEAALAHARKRMG